MGKTLKTLGIIMLTSLLLLLSSCGECTHEDTRTVRENEISATCTTAGSYDEVVYCNECQSQLSSTAKTISKTAHSEVTHSAKAPTCTDIGWERYVTCENENCNYTTYKELAEKHNYVDNVCTLCHIDYFSYGLKYTLSNDKTYYTISGIGECKDKDIFIPTTYKGLPVKAIGNSAFSGCADITSVNIPTGITTLGNSVFSGCKNLLTVTISDSVESIGNTVFSNCTSLNKISVSEDNAAFESIDFNLYSKGGETLIQYAIGKDSEHFAIPNTVTSIGNYAFAYNTALVTIDINNNVTSIGNYAFRDCTALATVIIPDSVTNLGTYAFRGCTSLTEATIGNGVKSIKNSTFNACDKLISVSLGNSLISIESAAFSGCSSLVNIIIPNTVTTIGDNAFNGCVSLKNITIPSGVTKIGVRVFYNCNNLNNVTIPSGVTGIGEEAFRNCISFTSITIPSSVKKIDEDAFKGCYRLIEVINESTLNIVAGSTDNGSIAGYAVEVHDGESKIVVLNNYCFYTYDNIDYLVTYIGDETVLSLPENYNGRNYEIFNYAFYNKDKITNVIIPNGVISIGGSAFYGCSSLESISVPFVGNIKNGATNTHFGFIFGASTYSENNSYIPTTLKHVIITGETNIDNFAFAGCKNLTSISILESVDKIGDGAFLDCTGLTTVNIASIIDWCNIVFVDYDSNPLNYARNLYVNGELATTLVILEGVTVIPDYAFYNCNSFSNIEIANGVTSIGYSAFAWCSSMNSIIIPDSVTSIGKNAFYACSSLESITLPFVGNTKNGNSNTHFGYIFGAPSYADNSSYIPASMKTVVITGGTSIGDSAFFSCLNLKFLTISDSITNIGNYAFQNCIRLSNVYYTGSESEWENISIGIGNENLTSAENIQYN